MSQPLQSIDLRDYDNWMENARLRTLLSSGLAIQPMVLVVMLGLFFLVIDTTPWPLVLLCIVGSLLYVGLRAWVLLDYKRLSNAGDARQLRQLGQRWRWLWPAGGAIWGMWTLCLYGQSDVTRAFAGWMLLSGSIGVAVCLMSAHLRHVFGFVTGFIASVLVSSILAEVLLLPEVLGRGKWMFVIMALFAAVMYVVAYRLNRVYEHGFKMRYKNNQLVTSLRQQNQLANEAVAFKDRFLASAAHDLKQPLHALRLYAEWLGAEPELVDELGPKILRSCQAVNGLFDSMFDMVRLDSGQLQPIEQPVDVARLLSDLEVQHAPAAREKGLQLRLRPVPGRLSADPILLQRIVGNLLGNAIRYTASGGVLLAVRVRGQGVAFEIWDSGIGVETTQQEHIFSPFYRVPTAGTSEGFGLGLTIVKRLCEELGYGLKMRSKLGRGSCFRVLVPRALQALPGQGGNKPLTRA